VVSRRREARCKITTWTTVDAETVRVVSRRRWLDESRVTTWTIGEAKTGLICNQTDGSYESPLDQKKTSRAIK
jgi:hypothetical protein